MFAAKVGLKAYTPSREWIIDSGASRHMTFEKNVLQQYKEFKAPEPVGLGDGRNVEALGVGSVKVTTQLHHGENVSCWISDVLYVPKLATNLFSVFAATCKGNMVSFKHVSGLIRNKKGKVIGCGSSLGNLYKLDCIVQQVLVDMAKSVNVIDLWHQWLAHVNHR